MTLLWEVEFGYKMDKGINPSRIVLDGFYREVHIGVTGMTGKEELLGPSIAITNLLNSRSN